MDYRKTNAPTTTVTRDMMELCEDTGNVYESVAIIGKRANQISVEIKNDLSRSWPSLLLTTIILRRYSRIANRLRFPVIMRSCRNRH